MSPPRPATAKGSGVSGRVPLAPSGRSPSVRYDHGVIIPLGTDRPLRRPTLVNHLLVGLNIVAFVALVIYESSDSDAAKAVRTALALDPRHPVWWAFGTYAI